MERNINDDNNPITMAGLEVHLPTVLGIVAVGAALLFNSLFWFAYSDRKASLFYSLAISSVFIIILILWFCYWNKKNSASLLLAASLLISGLAYGAVFTPFSAPDEDFHFSASYVLSNFLLGQGYQSEDPVPMRAGDASFFNEFDIYLNSSGYEKMVAGFESPSVSHTEVVNVITNRSHSITGNPPQCKIASALGITLGRLLGFNSYLTYYIGRLFNLILYIVVVVFAFRITPVGKAVFAAISLLPMSLHLAVSYSYDSFVIPMSLLLTALCLKAMFGTGLMRKGEWLSIGLVGALLAPCKVIYSLIVLMSLFIPKKRFNSRAEEVGIKVACILICFAPILITRLGSVMATAGVGASPQPALSARGGNANDLGTYYTISDVLQRPSKFILMVARTFDQFGFQYLQRTVGGSLGWFQQEITAPDLMVVFFTVLLVFSLIASKDDNRVLGTRCRLAGCLLFVMGVLSVMAALLFSWTFTTDNVIYGVQGRYFIPFLPWLLLGLRPKCIQINANSIPVLIGSVSFLNILNLVRIFSIALVL